MSDTDRASTVTPAVRHRVGDPLPAAMGVPELAQVFGICLQTCYNWIQDGKFKRFEFRRPIGSKKYSGRLVQAYLDSRNE